MDINKDFTVNNMVETSFETGVQHGEILGEIIIGMVAISGQGSLIFGTLATYRAVELIAQTHRRTSVSEEALFEEAIEAINHAF